MTSPCLSLPSIRERPGPEVGLDAEPDAGEPVRLEHEEQDDDDAEEQGVEIGHADADAVDERDGVAVVRDEAREATDEEPAEDRPEDRPDAADDHHGDELDRQ